MHGFGSRKFANGDVYTGEYKRGKRHGQGKLLFANGDLYSGQWEDDRFHGFARYYFRKNGRAYEGHFNVGNKQGKFKIQHANGDLDIVRYDQDRLVGQAVRWSKDRTKTWLLKVSSDQVSCKKQKRIPIAEAVSIGYGCEEEERGETAFEEPPIILPDDCIQEYNDMF